MLKSVLLHMTFSITKLEAKISMLRCSLYHLKGLNYTTQQHQFNQCTQSFSLQNMNEKMSVLDLFTSCSFLQVQVNTINAIVISPPCNLSTIEDLIIYYWFYRINLFSHSFCFVFGCQPFPRIRF